MFRWDGISHVCGHPCGPLGPRPVDNQNKHPLAFSVPPRRHNIMFQTLREHPHSPLKLTPGCMANFTMESTYYHSARLLPIAVSMSCLLVYLNSENLDFHFSESIFFNPKSAMLSEVWSIWSINTLYSPLSDTQKCKNIFDKVKCTRFTKIVKIQSKKANYIHKRVYFNEIL